jgi:hypothetical protein
MDTNQMNNPMAAQAAAGQQMFNELVERRKRTKRMINVFIVVALIISALTYVATTLIPKGDSATAETTDTAQ